MLLRFVDVVTQEKKIQSCKDRITLGKWKVRSANMEKFNPVND